MTPTSTARIFSNPNVQALWGSIGGYFGASVSALALVGLFGSRLRPLRIFLAAWTLAGLAGAINFVHVREVWNVIPLVNAASFPRYVMPSCEMAAIVLAALGLHELATRPRAQRLLTTASVVMVLVTLWCVNEARGLNRGVVLSHKARVIFIGLDLLPFIALALLLVISLLPRKRATTMLVALVLVGESLVLFFVPTAESPKQITIDYAPIQYLQKNQGEERFVDFAVLYPNWGTEFGVNSLSAIDLPFPEAFKNYIEDHLYPGLKPGNQFVIKDGLIGVEAMEAEVAKHFTAYEDASVKYLLVPSSVVLSPALAKLGVTEVFHDSLATIYQMPEPRGFFSTSSSSCSVTSTGDDEASVTCTGTGATLLRTELSMPGWKATVNGKSATITTVDGVYQAVKVPAGTSTVDYTFFPPHERYALLVGFLGGLFLIGSFIDERRRFVPRRRRSKEFAPPHHE